MAQTRIARFDMDHVDEEVVTSEEPTLKAHKIIIDLNGCRYEVGKHESSILSALCVILQLHCIIELNPELTCHIVRFSRTQ